MSSAAASSSYITEPAIAMSNVKDQVQKLIQEKDVAIFSKSYCPYCKKAKSTIQSLGLDDGAVGILELDEIRDGAEMQDYLESETGQRTVPSVWIKGKFIGGNSELSAIPRKDLEQRVKAAA